MNNKKNCYFHEILFSSFRGDALTSCFSRKFLEISMFKGA